MSFRDDLNAAELRQFEAWAKFQREHNLKRIAASASVVSVYPTSGEIDIDYALQVGACILLEKPLLVLVTPGMQLPEKLRLVADEVLEISIDDVDLGSDDLRAKVAEFMKTHVKEPS